jgi:hypothetical protein
MDAFSSGLAAFLPGGVPSTVVREIYVGRAPKIPSLADVITSGGLPNVTAVIQAFVLSLTAAANNTGQISPDRAGWRIFAGEAQGKTVVGRMVQQNQGWKLAAVQYGDLVWEAKNISQHLQVSPPPKIQGKDYELRLLAIPELNLEVFWLAAQTAGSTDLIFAAPSTVPLALPWGLPSAPLDMAHFLAEIRPLAASMLTMPARNGA